MTYLDIPGWFDFPEVYAAEIIRVPDGGTIVEVGCWLGRSTAYLAGLVRDEGRGIKLYAVDHGFGNSDKSADVCAPSLAEYGGNVAGRFVTNLRDCGVLDWATPIIASSVRAAELFADGSVDFAFIDGDHRYESVIADLNAWWPKIKPGGAIAGHDYDGHWPDVVRAVRDFFGRDVPHYARPTCWGVGKPAAETKPPDRNFPNATEADGVCTGEHVPETLAEEAADRIAELRAKVEQCEAALRTIDMLASFEQSGDCQAYDIARAALAEPTEPST